MSIWIVVAWLVIGLACAALTSIRPVPAVQWRSGRLATIILWPVALMRHGIELIVSRLPKPAGKPAYDFDDLLLIKNWYGSLALILGGVMLSFLAFGFRWPYWRIADMDLWVIYEGWLFVDRLPQEWFDHPGYFSILLTGIWYKLLHAAGLLDAYSLSADAAALAQADAAWQAAAQAVRVLSLLLAIAYLVGFAALLRRIVNDWRIASLATFALAFSGGFAMHLRMARTELISSGALVLALLLLIVAAREPSSRWRPLFVGFAAFAATICHINKIQFVFLICGLPIIAFAFGRPADAAETIWRKARIAVPVLTALAICAALAAVPATQLIRTGILQAPSLPWQPFMLGTFGVYQVVIAPWIVAAVLAFAVRWRVPPFETIATLLCILLGVSAGLLLLDLRYHPMNVIVVMNPLEQLLVWSKAADPNASTVKALLFGMLAVLRTWTFVLDTSARPTIFLEWLVVAGTIVAWRQDQRRLAVQVALLMGAVWTMDVISAVRGLKLQYFIITDPLTVIAAAWLLANMPSLRQHRYAFTIGWLLIVAHVAVSHAEPVKHTFLRSRPLDLCVKNFVYTKRIEFFPFCPQRQVSRAESTADGTAVSAPADYW